MPYLKYTVTIFILISTIISNAQINFQILTTKKSNNDAVVITDDNIVELYKDKIIYHVHKIITLNNPKSSELINFYEHYDDVSSIDFNYGNIYNNYGKLIKKIKKSDLDDELDVTEFATDTRVKYYEPLANTTTYPITVEYDYTIERKYLLYIPQWIPVPDFNVDVIHSSYKIIAENDSVFRYRAINLKSEPKITTNKNVKEYYWELSDFKGISEETLSPNFYELFPVILFAPTSISYNEYKTKFNSWNDFGSWIAGLNKGRNEIPTNVKEHIKAITKDKNSVFDKSKAIYDYMISITRYVSIQFGIGSYQPISASNVCASGYGDCKALSNLYVSMLKEAGIEAFYTLVLAGKNKNIIKDFPSNQFNHAIVCLPIGADTIWVECTSQKNPFGYIGDFTDNRDVLVVGQNSFITHTKRYNFNHNKTATNATIILDEYGDATCSINQLYSGKNSEYFYNIFNYLNTTEQKQKIATFYNFNNFTLNNYVFKIISDTIQQFELTTSFFSREFVSKSNSRMLFPINTVSPFSLNFFYDTLRRQPIQINNSYMVVDSVMIQYPKDYKCESNKIQNQFSNEFMDYSISFNDKNDKGYIYRVLKIKEGSFQSILNTTLINACKKIQQNDNQKIILKKI